MTLAALAQRLRAIQFRNFNRVQWLTENCRIRARRDLERMSDDERIGSFIACPDCGEPRVALPVALRLAEMAKSVPEWRDLVDAQEGFQDNIEAMQELGPITLT
jgi:hypothetical protein